MTICAMKDFDAKQRDCLHFLTEKRAYLHFPFFANTFSLPYHYANALRDESDLHNWEDAKRFLLEHNWEEPIPPLKPGRLNVFYATKAAFKRFSKTKKARKWDLVGIPFTKYEPLLVFTDFRSFLPHPVFEGGKPEELSRELMERIKHQRVQDIELLTDIPGQSAKLQKHLAEWGFSHKVYTVKEPVDALQSIDPADRVLRLYFYGAPTTSRMKDDLVRYIPFTIPSTLEWDDETTITQVCLAIPRDGADAEQAQRQKQLFSKVMPEYHARVFRAAQSDYTALLNVWWAYNRYAERKQHASTFKNPKAFAECLRDHHSRLK